MSQLQMWQLQMNQLFLQKKTANVELQMSQLQMCQLQMNQLFFQKIKNCKRGTANVSTAIVGNCKRLNGKLKKRLIRGGK